MSRYDFQKASIKQTGNRPLDDTQRAILAMQAVLNAAALRRETIFAYPTTLVAAGATLAAKPLHGVTGSPRKLLLASVAQSNAVATGAACRIYKLLRYRGTSIATIGRASTLDTAVKAFVPYNIPLVAAAIDFAIGDTLALVLEQTGVGPAVNDPVFTFTWEATP